MQKITIILLTALIALASGCTSQKKNYTTEDGFAQGSTYHIVYRIPETGVNTDSVQLSVKDSIKLYFSQINKSVSGYDTTSVLSRANRGENPLLDAIFVDVFNYAVQFYKESNGAVDASAAPLFDLWGFGFKNGVEITQENIDSLKQFIGMEKLSVKNDGNGSYLNKTDQRSMLNFNAIAQGYTVDYFCRKFDIMGITDYLIEIGGEVRSKGRNANGKIWKVGIDKPADGNYIQGASLQAIIELDNKALVTSGNYRKFYVKDGVKYSHTIDPIAGYPVQHSLLSATVVAEDATTADAYATYFMVVGIEKAKEILAATPGMEALLIYGEQNQMKEYYTPGLKEILKK